MRCIAQSMLDTDHYKLTMSQAIFNQFQRVKVWYEFINRGGTKFPKGFDTALKQQLELMSLLHMTKPEYDWLRSIRYIKPTFAEWLYNYRYDPSEVVVHLSNEGDLSVKVHGFWYRTCPWEVPILYTISELYGQIMGITPKTDWYADIKEKGKYLSSNECTWVDFSTRRRFNFAIQSAVVDSMRGLKGFYGTSNLYLAFQYGLTPIGTVAHEFPMVISAKCGVRMANKVWMDAWIDEYEGDLGIALPDTFTSEVFLRDFNAKYAKLFDGIRQDSGSFVKKGQQYIDHYRSLGIDPKSKKIIFSDSLNCEKAVELTKSFSEFTQVHLGIGTHFSNDVGHKPLNIVMKVVAADFGQGRKPVVKLSDTPGKVTGEPEAVDHAKWESAI